MILTEDFYVGYSRVNGTYDMTNTSIMEMLEDISCMHSEQVGDGVFDSDMRWFLSSYHVRIFRRPRYKEEIKATTWSREMRGITASREYEIRYPDGTLSAIGISTWVRMNMATGKMERITPEVSSAYQSEPERHNFDSVRIPKLTEPEGCDLKDCFTVNRDMIDGNGHMNNVVYIKQAQLMLSDEMASASGEVPEFYIMFHRAIPYKAKVICCVKDDTDSLTVTMKTEDESDIYAIVKLMKALA